MNIKIMLVVTCLASLQGCMMSAGIDERADAPTLASATSRGAQFGPAASTILGSAMDINGCGSTNGTPATVQDPTITSSAELRDKNGNVTYDYNASASKVHKCSK